MRYVIGRRKKHQINDNVRKIIDEEQKNKLDTVDSCVQFKKNCENSKINTIKKIEEFKSQNKKICGYAATAKSTTVLNYCGINNKMIDFICDTTKEKIGKYSPGSHIPLPLRSIKSSAISQFQSPGSAP